VRILYGVAGEGMGHAIRSSVVRDHLVSQGHTIQFACPKGRASKYLNRYGAVVSVPGFMTSIVRNRLDPLKSILDNIPRVAKMSVGPAFLLGLPRPDLVISDFEPCTASYANMLGIPVVAIDNIHFVSRCQHPRSVFENDKKAVIMSLPVFSNVVPKAYRYMVTTFVGAPVRYNNTTIHTPILRDFQAPTRSRCSGDRVVVYLNDKADWISAIQALQTCTNIKFNCYGSGHSGSYGNVTLLPVSDDFKDDVARSRAVISGAGFSTMTECIYNHVPLLALPFEGYLEQILNSNYLTALGYGQRCHGLTPQNVDEFLQRCPEFSANLADVTHDQNHGIFDSLDRMLGS
jgi:uncharacterized protein (TIGR00661 family)